MIATVKQELFGEKVHFTPLQMVNIYRHFEWNNDPELNRLDSELPYAKESFGAFKRRFEMMLYRPSMNSQDFEVHAIDGALIGVAEITDISEHNRHCNVNVTIGDRAYWGQDYGLDALRVLLAYCFDVLRMHRVTTQALAYNTAWQEAVERLGFKREGVERDFVYRDGAYWDRTRYALLEEAYRATVA